MYVSTPTSSFRSMTEPMNLGNSPPGYGHGSSSPLTAGQQYYPEYLLGDPSSGCLSQGSRMWSTGFSVAQSASKGRPFPNQTSPNSSQSQNQTQAASASLRFSRSSAVKPGGPPVQGLFDAGTHSSPFNLSTPAPLHSSIGPHNERSFSESVLGQSYSSFTMSPAQLDPFYTQGESLRCDDQLDDTWVTVFGFPPAAASYILQQFSHYGTILEHKMTNHGNWMHIHFNSRLHAKKALSKNGKVFNGNMMIGVSTCIDKSIMADSMKENLPSMCDNESGSVASDGDGTARRSSIVRPLTRAYKTASREHEVTPTGHTPQKKNTIVTKAMEYVLGW